MDTQSKGRALIRLDQGPDGDPVVMVGGVALSGAMVETVIEVAMRGGVVDWRGVETLAVLATIEDQARACGER